MLPIPVSDIFHPPMEDSSQVSERTTSNEKTYSSPLPRSPMRDILYPKLPTLRSDPDHISWTPTNTQNTLPFAPNRSEGEITADSNKTNESMANMTNYLRDAFLRSKTNLLNRFRETERMMFPIRNDVTIDCDSERSKGNSRWCKIVRVVFLVLGILLLILLLNALTENKDEEKEEPEQAPPSCTVEIGDRMKEEIKSWIQKEVQNNAKICAKSNRMNPEQMRNIVKEEIKRQQKIQLKPDFASASAGGMIIEASPTWTEGYSYIYFLFIPIRSMAPPPSTILEPTRQAGDCWPMAGQKGRLLIQLAARANIVGFTMEHIDPAMSLSGGTPEAPNNFSVYGIEDIEDISKRHLFGTYCYDNKNEEENQYFRVQNINRKSFLYILLEISSNHGNEKYTCVYRFQVHGFIDRAYHCQS